MITLRRSDTGSYVLVHEPSQTVMVGDDLEATYAQMQEHLREHSWLGPAGSGSPLPPAASTSRRAWMVGLGVLALLPFLWLSVLHYTLGRLVDELRTPAAHGEVPPAQELDKLTTELHELEQTVARLETEVSAARQNPATMPGRRTKRPLRPEDRSVVEGGDPDEGDDGDEAEEAEGVEDSDDAAAGPKHEAAPGKP